MINFQGNWSVRFKKRRWFQECGIKKSLTENWFFGGARMMIIVCHPHLLLERELKSRGATDFPVGLWPVAPRFNIFQSRIANVPCKISGVILTRDGQWNKNHYVKSAQKGLESPKSKLMKNLQWFIIDISVTNPNKVLFKIKLVLWSANTNTKWSNWSSKDFRNWCPVWTKWKILQK